MIQNPQVLDCRSPVALYDSHYPWTLNMFCGTLYAILSRFCRTFWEHTSVFTVRMVCASLYLCNSSALKLSTQNVCSISMWCNNWSWKKTVMDTVVLWKQTTWHITSKKMVFFTVTVMRASKSKVFKTHTSLTRQNLRHFL